MRASPPPSLYPSDWPAKVRGLLNELGINCAMEAPCAKNFAYAEVWAAPLPRGMAIMTVGEAKRRIRWIIGAAKMGLAWGRRYTLTKLQPLLAVGAGEAIRPAGVGGYLSRKSGRLHWGQRTSGRMHGQRPPHSVLRPLPWHA